MNENHLTRLVSRVLALPMARHITDKTIVRLADYCRFAGELPDVIARQEQTRRRESKFLEEMFSSRCVQSGPFAGLIYPEFAASGSELLPKLIGSYEYELHGVVRECLSREYKCVIDVGCAEGYYAVGFARQFPRTQVYAADVNEIAISRCTAMAEANGVDDRVATMGFCGPDELRSLVAGDRCLVFSDCEGYELELFNSTDLLDALCRCDILVECHDYKHPEISETLIHRFRSTHRVTTLFSADQMFRPFQYTADCIDGMELAERVWLLNERRGPMMWHFFESQLS